MDFLQCLNGVNIVHDFDLQMSNNVQQLVVHYILLSGESIVPTIEIYSWCELYSEIKIGGCEYFINYNFHRHFKV